MSMTSTFSRGLALIGLAALPGHAAFIIEASDSPSLGAGHFTYTGTGGTTASFSDASPGLLPATTDSPPTFFTLRHAFGGNGTTDQYTFTYTPATDTDNVSFTPGTIYNLQQGLSSSGLDAGAAGFYNVYRLHPETANVSGGPTLYEVFVGGGLQASESIDQNFDDLATGVGVGRWERIGSVAVPDATDTLTVTMTATNATFTSMRASGIMFEYAGPIPEPGCLTLAALGLATLTRRRRR